MNQLGQMTEATPSGHGRSARSPLEVPPKGWRDILWRTWKEIGEDRVTLIAAGSTYYLLLSLFPLLAAFASLYGLFTDPADALEQVRLLATVVPAGGLDLISDQLQRLTSQSGTTLGIGLLISLALALWSASTGVKTMFEAMNVAYGEREKRNFFVVNGLALLFVAGGLVGALLMIAVVVAMPAALSLFGLSKGTGWLVQGAGYVLLALALLGGILVLYRFGPSRQQAKWRWLLPGAILATVCILVVSGLFSWYSANFANFEKTYGSLAGLVAFLTWIWLSVTAVIVGAEFSAEAEHQTARDSTIGADAPMGQRDARMADTLGATVGAGETSQPRSHGGTAIAERRGHEPAPGPGHALQLLAIALPLLAILSRGNRRRSHGSR